MKKKLLIIAGHANSLINFRLPLIKAFLKQNLEVHAAAPNINEKEKVVATLTSLGVNLHEIQISRAGLNPITDFKTLCNLISIMRNIKPTYVLGYTIKPVIYGNLAAKLTKIPKRFSLITGLGYAFMDHDSIKRKLVSYIAQILYKISLKSSSLVFFQNPDDKNLFQKLRIIDKNTSTLVVNGSGVNLEEYPFTALEKNKPFRFLLIARLLADKGIREYIEAAKKLKKEYPHIQFDLVGSIDTNPNSIKQDELNFWIKNGYINYLGYLSDVRPAITACHIYVLPSYREGTPRSVLEAMSMGRPIITTDAPGCRETVVHGENGFLVPIKDPNALVETMKKFIDNPELIESMGKRSRAIAEEKYDVHKVNQQMLKAMKLYKLNG